MRLRTLLAGAIALAGLAAASPTLAVGTVILANGGANFAAHGPSAYWHHDAGQGYCGSASWPGCAAPHDSQWTYATHGTYPTNWAAWSDPYLTTYPESAKAFIPCVDATATVNYDVHFSYVSTFTAVVDQLPYCNQWALLGQGLPRIDYVYLYDDTWWNTSRANSKVSFDEIKIEN